MYTGASTEAANLHANWLGLEVRVEHPDGVMTAEGTIDKFSIAKYAAATGADNTAVSPVGYDQYVVKIWIQGHKLEIPGSNIVTLHDGGLPSPLPAR